MLLAETVGYHGRQQNEVLFALSEEQKRSTTAPTTIHCQQVCMLALTGGDVGATHVSRHGSTDGEILRTRLKRAMRSRTIQCALSVIVCSKNSGITCMCLLSSLCCTVYWMFSWHDRWGLKPRQNTLKIQAEHANAYKRNVGSLGWTCFLF